MPIHFIFDKLSDKTHRLKIALQVSKLGFSPIVTDALKSGSVTVIGDFWQPFCVGKNNGGHKGRPRKTTIARGK